MERGGWMDGWMYGQVEKWIFYSYPTFLSIRNITVFMLGVLCANGYIVVLVGHMNNSR